MTPAPETAAVVCVATGPRFEYWAGLLSEPEQTAGQGYMKG